jgi:mannose-6-phosphate isomerase-like protein (cupin superfamily)
MKNKLHRRGFLGALLAFASTKVFANGSDTATTGGFSVKNGEDRHGKERVIASISRLLVKVGTADTQGGTFIFEHRHTAKGGPARHFHYAQDEWWYVLEGTYIAEIGDQRYRLEPGDSIFGPRRVPHAFAFVGDTVGRVLIVFQPAGRMEELFDSLAGQGGFSEASRLPEYGVERVGPPLAIE